MMGCVSSKADINDFHPNIFHVMNVDDMGNHLNSGKLEITESDLVLHQKGKTPIRWPLKCLRRYGFDAEMFSFESGRRCPTGPGIYAFKCRRAEQLFNLLQGHIQNRNERGDNVSRDFSNQLPNSMSRSELSVDNASLTDISGYVEPVRTRNTSTRRSLTHRASNGSGIVWTSGSGTPLSPTNSEPPNSLYVNQEISERDSVPNSVPTRTSVSQVLSSLHTVPEYINSSVMDNAVESQDPETVSNGNTVSEDRPSYVNLGPNGLPPSLDINTNYAKLDDLLKTEQEATMHLYMNVTPENAKEKSPAVLREHFYANLGHGEPERKGVRPGVGYANVREKPSDPNSTPVRHVNYIELDLDRGSDSTQTLPTSPLGSVSSCPESPQRACDGYTTIDFDKTAALSNSVNPNPRENNNEEGLRKTRHNSNMHDFMLSRANSSTSD